MIDYFKISKSPFFSLIITIPLFIIYELGIFYAQKNEISTLKNGADVIIEDILSFFGFSIFYTLSFFLLFFALFFSWKHKKNFKSLKLRFSYFILFLIESVLYSLLLVVIIKSIPLLIEFKSMSYFDLTLLIGAGIYEELFFRVILITFFTKILQFIFTNSSKFFWIPIILSSIIFSLFHFIGIDTFSQDAFTLRFIGGIYLALVYHFRGFAMASVTHSLYDIIVFFS